MLFWPQKLYCCRFFHPRCGVAQRVFLVLRSLVYITGFMFLWLWVMPRWLKLRTSFAFPAAAPPRWLGLIPLVVGLVIALACFTKFVTVGRGTPAPFDAPRRLVITGVYRFVRNPMYLGTGLFLAGCAILFSEFSITLVWYALGIIIGVNLFVLFYEEPTLRRKFNGDYEEYCRSVRRWIPRLRPWRGLAGRAKNSA